MKWTYIELSQFDTALRGKHKDVPPPPRPIGEAFLRLPEEVISPVSAWSPHVDCLLRYLTVFASSPY